jgi:dihydrofolate synthase / folylpolyglutamate synthase
VLELYPGLDRLLGQPEMKKSFALNLDRPKRVAAALANPQNIPSSIHITGTNGKGTVGAYLAAMLYGAEYTVGHLISPHLTEVTERCVINGSPITYSAFNTVVEEVYDAADRLGEPITFFETAMLAGMLEIAKKGMDWSVVEVGLGGRLDASNIIRSPRVTVITSIGLDHVHILGSTTTEIAYDKSHIFREGVPAICGVRNDDVRVVISEVAAKIGARPEFLGRDFDFDTQKNEVQSGSGVFKLPVKFAAVHQYHNAAVAIRAAQVIGMTDEAISKGLVSMRWPGRLEWFDVPHGDDDSRSVLVDGAHNPDGVAALLDYLSTELPARGIEELIVVISILGSKDWERMLVQLGSLSKMCRSVQWILTSSGYHRALSPDVLQEKVGSGCVIANPIDALNTALSLARRRSAILVSGSLYLVGVLRPYLTSQRFRTIDSDIRCEGATVPLRGERIDRPAYAEAAAE